MNFTIAIRIKKLITCWKFWKFEEELARTIVSNIVHIVITQLAQDNTGTHPEVSLKAMTFGTYRQPSRDSQGIITKIYGLWFIDKTVF